MAGKQEDYEYEYLVQLEIDWTRYGTYANLALRNWETELASGLQDPGGKLPRVELRVIKQGVRTGYPDYTTTPAQGQASIDLYEWATSEGQAITKAKARLRHTMVRLMCEPPEITYV